MQSKSPDRPQDTQDTTDSPPSTTEIGGRDLWGFLAFSHGWTWLFWGVVVASGAYELLLTAVVVLVVVWRWEGKRFPPRFAIPQTQPQPTPPRFDSRRKTPLAFFLLALGIASGERGRQGIHGATVHSLCSEGPVVSCKGVLLQRRFPAKAAFGGGAGPLLRRSPQTIFTACVGDRPATPP